MSFRERVYMRIVEPYSFPKIEFAHIYKTERYSNNFIPVPDMIEITHLEEGNLSIIAEGIQYEAQKGDIICFLRNSYLKIWSTEFHCHHTVCATLKWKETDGFSKGFILPFIVKSQKGTDEIQKAVDDFIYTIQLQEYGSVRASVRFLDILCKIDSVSRNSDNISLPSETLYAERAKKYIYQHIHDSITLSDVSGSLGISAGYLCGIFKNEYGISLMKYVNKTKLESIKKLMDNENVRLYEAATIFGYKNANYVSFLYKKIFGRNITDKPSMAP